MSVVFVGGNLALDFVGTLNERGHSRVENLQTPPDLADWFVLAGVLDRRVRATEAEWAGAIELREAIFRLVQALIDGADPAPGDLRQLNRAAAVPPPTIRVVAGRAGLGDGRRVERQGDLASALSAVARAGLELFALPDDAVLKWCANPTCTHPYLDRSRGHRRRWCDMAACGDRAKAAAYRARARREATPSPR